ncbi:apolipoprotein N-acyltransferase [Spirillospora sp. NPDC049652]
MTGALPILAFPRADLGWLAWTALVPGMLLLAHAASNREAAFRGWAFGVGYLLAALYWTLPYIGPALPLIAVVFGALWGPWGVAVRMLVPRHPGFALLVLPSAWLTIELARSRPALGGPWAVYGATQWHHPTELTLAALGGVWLISFALVAANTALTLAVTTLPSLASHPSLFRPFTSTHPEPTPATTPHPEPALSRRSPSAFFRSAPSATGDSEPGSSATGFSERWGDATSERSGTGCSASVPSASDPPPRGPSEHVHPTGRSGSGGGGRGGRRRMGIALGMVGLVLAIVGVGPLLYSMRAEPGTARTMRVNLVQTGVVTGAGRRLVSGFQMTEAAPPADLTVWGESSVGVDLDRSPAVVQRLRALAAARGPLLVNVDAEDAQGRISKTAVLVGPEGLRGRYTKTRLVPFGEYIPFRDAFGWLSDVSKAAGQDRVPGTGPTLMTSDGTRFGPLICFESAFPDLGRTLVRRGAEVIVYQSATSSFQNSWAPAQHASLAAVRAAETGRPVVQAAQTGVSAAFDARGRRLTWFDTDRRGTVSVTLDVPRATSRTLYDRVGDVVPFVSLVTTAGMIVIAVWKRQKEVKGRGVSKRG